MKTFLIALAFVGANAMACPDAAKDAWRPAPTNLSSPS